MEMLRTCWTRPTVDGASATWATASEETALTQQPMQRQMGVDNGRAMPRKVMVVCHVPTLAQPTCMPHRRFWVWRTGTMTPGQELPLRPPFPQKMPGAHGQRSAVAKLSASQKMQENQATATETWSTCGFARAAREAAYSTPVTGASRRLVHPHLRRKVSSRSCKARIPEATEGLNHALAIPLVSSSPLETCP